MVIYIIYIIYIYIIPPNIWSLEPSCLMVNHPRHYWWTTHDKSILFQWHLRGVLSPTRTRPGIDQVTWPLSRAKSSGKSPRSLRVTSGTSGHVQWSIHRNLGISPTKKVDFTNKKCGFHQQKMRISPTTIVTMQVWIGIYSVDWHLSITNGI